MPDSRRIRVVIAGGGVAAVEAVLALEACAADRVHVTLVTPDPQLEVRALAVTAPFSDSPERRRFPLAPLLARCGGELVQDALAEVWPGQRVVRTQAGATIAYDALIVAVGGRLREPWPGVATFGTTPLSIGALLAHTESASTRRIAFVVPPGIAWPLPAYELALLTRRRATELGMEPEINVVTPEEAPLAVFGRGASARVAALLCEAGIAVHAGVRAAIALSGRIRLAPSAETLDPQRIVALPLVGGPRVPGLPADRDGFVRVDAHGRVEGLRDVYCVGDAANYPIKQGGLATQQADAAALHIAALAGAAVTAPPFRPVLRGRLLTGGGDQFFVKPVHRPAGEQGPAPLWWPPTKVSGRHLTPWIAAQDPSLLPPEPLEHTERIERPLSPVDPAGRAA